WSSKPPKSLSDRSTTCSIEQSRYPDETPALAPPVAPSLGRQPTVPITALHPGCLPSVPQAQIQPFPPLGPRPLARAEPLDVDVGKLGDPPEHARWDRPARLVAVPLP